MSSVRGKLLLAIYRHFEQWLQGSALFFACKKGCATCCTQNVNMTAVEGERVHRFINDKGRHRWFAEKLNTQKPRQQAGETTNEFAARCLNGEDGVDPDRDGGEAVCPYVAEGSCQIYEVRPFACRSFASLKKCFPGQAAELPPFYITASTAAQQLIEHVGQGEYWGNMHDVLLALCDLRENDKTAALLTSHSMADQARSRLKKAKPLPGFLIDGAEYEKVSPFIFALFHEKIGKKTVEDILNGK